MGAGRVVGVYNSRVPWGIKESNSLLGGMAAARELMHRKRQAIKDPLETVLPGDGMQILELGVL